MEQTTLQQRIEERAEEQLLQDLKEIADKEFTVSNFIGRELYPQRLNIHTVYPQYGDGKERILIKNEFTQTVFEAALPRYIKNVTDDILRKIDEIDFLVSDQKVEEY